MNLHLAFAFFLLPAAGLAAGPVWQKHSVALGESIRGIDVADIDGNGEPDIVANCIKGEFKDSLVWLENTGAGFTRHFIARNSADVRPHYLDAKDMNGDGVLDVAVSNGHGQGIAWFKGPRWTKHVIDASITDAHALAIADFNQDGSMDIVTASFSQKVVKWYQSLHKFVRHFDGRSKN